MSPANSIAALLHEWLNFRQFDSTNDDEAIVMLAEKFFLLLETLRSHASDDKPPVVISTAPHIPIAPMRNKEINPRERVGAAKAGRSDVVNWQR